MTRAGEYAVRCVLYLAREEGRGRAPRREIARAMDVPFHFLGKIGQKLAQAGIIHIVQGAQGRFELVRPAGDISLLDVVEAVDGEIFLNDCVLRPGSCSMNQGCSVHQVWLEARDALRRTLASANFADLAARGVCPVEDGAEISDE